MRPRARNGKYMPSSRKLIENLMGDVIGIIGNHTVNFKMLAETARGRKLTEHEFESMRHQVDLCKSFVKERFLKELINLEKEGDGPGDGKGQEK